MRAESPQCTVLRHLPSDRGENLYRVKCPSEAFERNVRESELAGETPHPDIQSVSTRGDRR
jgi:hypothetical protein